LYCAFTFIVNNSINEVTIILFIALIIDELFM
jgi:hypothetical protein